MKNLNVKRLLKNVAISTLIANFICTIFIIVTLLIPVSDFNRASIGIAKTYNPDNPSETDRNTRNTIIQYYSQNATDDFLEKETINNPNFINNLVILRYANWVYSTEIIKVYSLFIIVGFIAGVVYYNMFGVKISTKKKSHIRKILTNYVLIGIIALMLSTLHDLVFSGETLTSYFENGKYQPILLVYTIVFVVIYIMNYIYQKHLSKKLNEVL